MRPTIPLIIAATLGFVLGQGMANQGAAKVVSNGKAAVSNPAVEVGGYHVRPGVTLPIQYSLILAPAGQWLTSGIIPWRTPRGFWLGSQGSCLGFQGSWLASQSHWLRQCAIWPWGFFGSPAFRHPAPFGRIPGRPPINWLLTPLP